MAFKRSSVRSRSAPPNQNTKTEAEIGERSASCSFLSPDFSPLCLSSRFRFFPLFYAIQVAPKVAPKNPDGFLLVEGPCPCFSSVPWNGPQGGPPKGPFAAQRSVLNNRAPFFQFVI